jgi:AraC-like DNA-binding protein
MDNRNMQEANRHYFFGTAPLSARLGLTIEGLGQMFKQAGDRSFGKARVLQSYAFVQVTAGSGFFRSRPTGERPVRTGDCLVLLPGIAHEYGPDCGQQWDEYWCIFSGYLPDAYLRQDLFEPEDVIRSVGNCPELIAQWQVLLDAAAAGMPPLQLMEAFMPILVRLAAAGKTSGSLPENRLRSCLEALRRGLQDEVADDPTIALDGTSPFRPAIWARQSGYSYAHLRRAFTQTYGLSPEQYRAERKCAEAKRRLLASDTPIKEIAIDLGFSDQYYFSRFFRKLAGLSPRQFRERHAGLI